MNPPQSNQRSSPLARFLRKGVWVGVGLLLVLAAARVVAAERVPVVLVLHSYHQGLHWSDEVQRGFSDALRGAGATADVYVEYLDVLRFPPRDAAHRGAVVDGLLRRFAPRPPDVVVAIDDAAFDLALEYRHRLAPQPPLLFAGINNLQPARLEGLVAVAGVAESPSFADTLQLMRAMLPAMRSVLWIGDGSRTGRANQAGFEAALAALADPPGLMVVEAADIEAAEAAVAAAPEDVAVFLAARLSERGGRLLPEAELARRISLASPVPVFSAWAFFLGHGIVGGRLISGEHQGREVAGLLLRLLAGEQADALPTLLESPNPYGFDHRELARRGLDGFSLPPNALRVNAPVTLWDSHREQVLAILAALLLLVAALLFLLAYLGLQRRGEARLRESELLFRNLFENASVGIGHHDLEGRVLRANSRYIEILGGDRAALHRGALPAMFGEAAREQILSGMRRIRSGELSTCRQEWPLVTDGGESRWLSLSLGAGRDGAGVPRYLISAVEDVTERKRSELRLRQSGAVLESTSEAVMVTDPNERIIAVNRAFSEITGYAEAEVLGLKPTMLDAGRHDADFFESIWNHLICDGHWQGEIWKRCKSGEVIPLWHRISEIRGEDGLIGSYVSVMSDISALKESQAELEHLAAHDALTGLPNRSLLQSRLEHALHRARREGVQVAVLFLDLDRFKNINDSLGHHVGDLLLKEVASRLLHAVRADDTVARLGGDEFVVVLEGLTRSDVVDGVAEKIISSVVAPLDLPGLPPDTRIGTSVGIALYPQDGDEAATLLRNADTAMYRAKEEGRGLARFYCEQMGANAVDRFMLENELRRAIETGEIEIHLQALVHLADGAVYGAEALARWRHPERGMIFPDRFIRLAEETGLIVPLGQRVLELACDFAMRARRAGHVFERIAVNVSPAQLNRVDFVDSVARVLRDSGLPANVLELEITENFAMSEAPQLLDRLLALTALGVTLAVDDFGTGYSNLGHLKRLPVSKLKIDRGFVEGLPADTNDLAIARTVIALGRNLGFDVLAEGIESVEQATVLHQEGCSDGQGYLFARPLPPADFLAFIGSRQAAAELPECAQPV